MNSFEVTDPERMRLILRTFSCLDEIRWSTSANYNLINYSQEDLTPDEKLLTHWLCYIMDRQMPFLRIWEVGGYVISHLVRSYTRGDHESVRKLLDSYVRQNENKVSLECPLESENARLASYGISEKGKPVRFASRYMPDDLVRIYRTLAILDKTSGRNLPRFIAAMLHEEDDHRRSIKRIATALDKLSYDTGGSFTVKNFKVALDKMDQDVKVFVPEVNTRKRLFGRKRLWCSLRDYLKSPEFNDSLVAGLRDAGVENPERWERNNPALKRSLSSLELPGDVWNNADVFRKGLFSPCLGNERSSWDMPYTIRKIYDQLAEEQEIDFYPEQLDVTFDFVPRMCENKMCGVCVFGDGVEELCHQQPDYLCPVVLVACGYRHKCSPDTCGFKQNSVKGFCRSSIEQIIA